MQTLKQAVLTMRKPRLAVLAPMIQLVVAIALLLVAHRTSAPKGFESSYYVPTAALVCYGINAPASLVKLIGMLVVFLTNRPISIHGFGIEDAWFLVGVTLVWYMIGRKLDRLRSVAESQKLRKLSATEIMVKLLLLLLGGYFFYLAIEAFLVFGKWNNPTGNIAEGFLFLAWSVVLILLPAKKLLNGRVARTPSR
jgi:hypothetical protein